MLILGANARQIKNIYSVIINIFSTQPLKLGLGSFDSPIKYFLYTINQFLAICLFYNHPLPQSLGSAFPDDRIFRSEYIYTVFLPQISCTKYQTEDNLQKNGLTTEMN